MPPDNKQTPLSERKKPAELNAQGLSDMSKESTPRFLSFGDIVAKKGPDAPEDLKVGIRLLRTFQSDVAEAMKGDEGSLVKMAIAENQRKDAEREEITKRMLLEESQRKAIEQEELAKQAMQARAIETPEITIPTPIPTIVIEPPKKILTTPEGRTVDSILKTLEGASTKKSIPQILEMSAESRLENFSQPTGFARPQPTGRVGQAMQVEQVKRHHVILPLALSLFFFIVGMGALYIVYTKITTPGMIMVDTVPASFSNYQYKVLTDGFTRGQLITSINTLKTSSVYSADSLLNIVLVETDPLSTKDGKKKERLIETSGMFSFLGTRAQPSFMRSLDPQFVLGLHMINGGQPFLIFKTGFYDSTFAGMLAWEKTMASDLVGVFTKENPQATSTANIGEKLGDWNDTFEDKVVKNKDVRILKDSSGKTILLYSFINKETLIITTNEETFNEIYGRLTISNFKR